MEKKSKSRSRKPSFLLQWRQYRRQSQEQLAGMARVTQETISRLERGQIAYTQDVLEAAAKALKCTPSDLLGRDPAVPDPFWTVWDAIPKARRGQALSALLRFAQPADLPEDRLNQNEEPRRRRGRVQIP